MSTEPPPPSKPTCGVILQYVVRASKVSPVGLKKGASNASPSGGGGQPAARGTSTRRTSARASPTKAKKSSAVAAAAAANGAGAPLFGGAVGFGGGYGFGAARPGTPLDANEGLQVLESAIMGGGGRSGGGGSFRVSSTGGGGGGGGAAAVSASGGSSGGGAGGAHGRTPFSRPDGSRSAIMHELSLLGLDSPGALSSEPVRRGGGFDLP
jgi:hypothetical protein